MLNQAMSRLAVAVFWLLHFLPQRALAVFGRKLGLLLYCLAGRRKQIVSINLAWCFPDLNETERRRLVKANFEALGQSLVDRTVLWWGSTQRVSQMFKIVGEEKIKVLQEAGRPVILLAPHFVGLDVGGIAIAHHFDVVSIYAPQRNPVFNRLFYNGRLRFGDQLLLSRGEGVRATIKAMKTGRPFYYLPDLNHHRRDSIFVPFFGIPTATITGLSRLSKAAGAAVVPCVTRMLPAGEGYCVDIGDAWAGFPTEDVEADTARMNAWIESVVRTMPEQYFWLHRRFKTRPEGEARPY